MVKVDLLDPNGFARTGQTADIEEAWRDGLWIGTFNLWVVQDSDDGQYVLYQRRRDDAAWAPSCLDVAAGGHYDAGEVLFQGLREAEEELGRVYLPHDVTFLGRRLYVADTPSRRIRNVVDVCIVKDNTPLQEFKPQESELAGLYKCPIDELIDLHERRISSCRSAGVKFVNGSLQPDSFPAGLDSFPYNWDDYHRKMAYLCRRFLAGESPLIY